MNMGAKSISALLIVVLCACCAHSGCVGDRADSKQLAGLKFSQTSVDVGVTDGQSRIVREFPFEVIAEEGVKIISLNASCDCIGVSSEEIGRRLNCGQRGSVRVEVTQDGSGGRIEGSVYVNTEPKGLDPIVLTVTGVARGTPNVTCPSPLAVNCFLGQRVEVSFDIVYHRPKNDSILVMDSATSELANYSVDSHTIEETVLSPSGSQAEPAVREVHHFRLLGPELREATKRSDRLSIGWIGTTTKTTFDVMVTPKHQLDLSASSVFVGFVTAGEKKEIAVKFVQAPRDPAAVVVVPAAEYEGAIARLSEDGDAVLVSLAAPSELGRFTRQWIIRDALSEVPGVCLTVTAIVHEEPSVL